MLFGNFFSFLPVERDARRGVGGGSGNVAEILQMLSWSGAEVYKSITHSKLLQNEYLGDLM